jgi:predicted Zn-dependent protease
MCALLIQRSSLWRRLLAVGVALCLLLGQAANSYALFGRFTAEDERKLSEKFLVQVRQRFDIVEDPAVNAYIGALGARLAAQLDYTTFPYHFYVINSETLNAFAAPGGHIFVFSGLITRLNSEGELASIMAHEMGHVSNRHIAKQMERGSKIGLATLALALAGAFLGGGGQASEAAAMTSLAAGASLQLKYTRENEEEADRTGLALMRKAGYDGNEMVNALRTIYRYRWYGSDDIPAYLSTHPGTGDRIGYLEDSLLANPSAGATYHGNPLALQKVQTRLMAFGGDPKLAVARFEGQVKERPTDFLAQYGLGLAYMRMEQAGQAQAALRRAIALRPNDPDLLRDLGRSYFEAGKMDEALKALRQAQAASPDDAATLYYVGRASQEAGQLQAAYDSYKRLLAAGLESEEIYRQLGLVCAKKGDQAAGHYYAGLAFQLKGDASNAVFHLSQALPLYAGKPEEEKVKAALKDAQDELADRPKEQHNKTAPPSFSQSYQPAQPMGGFAPYIIH